MQTLSGSRIAGTDLVGIDVTGTLARLAILAVYFRVSVVTRCAGFTTGAVVTRKTIAAYLGSFLVHLATGGEVVRRDWQRTGTNETIGGCPSGSVSIVAFLAEFAVIPRCAVLAVLQ